MLFLPDPFPLVSVKIMEGEVIRRTRKSTLVTCITTYNLETYDYNNNQTLTKWDQLHGWINIINHNTLVLSRCSTHMTLLNPLQLHLNDFSTKLPNKKTSESIKTSLSHCRKQYFYKNRALLG
jgi:hypothetical protein